MTELSRPWLRMIVFPMLCLQLAACALTPPPKAPRAMAAAERHNARGISALEQGRFASAEAEFAESYRGYASVENFPGMVRVLINSSRLYRGQGQIARAAAMIDRAAPLVARVPELAAEVWFEKGKIALLQSDPDGALLWADRALQVANDGNRAMILNLGALLLLQKNDLQRAEERANTALKESRSNGERHEEANALRTLADIALSRGNWAAAESFYLGALEIDKQLADSRAIRADLHGLAVSAQQAGRQRAAADYLIRAADVALFGGDSAAALAAYARAAELCGEAGDAAAAAAVTDKLNRLRRETSGSRRE